MYAVEEPGAGPAGVDRHVFAAVGLGEEWDRRLLQVVAVRRVDVDGVGGPL